MDVSVGMPSRLAIVGRGSIRLGGRAGGAEELGQLVGNRVHVVAELADEVGLCLVVEVADELSRGCGAVAEFLEGGSVEGDRHDQRASRIRCEKAP